MTKKKLIFKEVHSISQTRNNQSQMKIKIGVIQLLHSESIHQIGS